MGMPAAISPVDHEAPLDPEVSERDHPNPSALNAMEESQIIKFRPCFGTDERYFCKRNCEWASRCKKLRAEWLR